MVQALTGKTRFIVAAASIFAAFAFHATAQEDPPYRVARLNYIYGTVSMRPAGLDDWAPAAINRPFTIGDYLYTDQGARAELHVDNAVIRMGYGTNYGFLNLNDQTVQLSLTGGDMYFRLHNFTPDQTFEIDTPNAAVTLLRDGIYRFRVDPDGAMTFVVVRQGSAQVTGGGQSFTLDAGNSAELSGTDQLSFDVELAPNPDDFDNWCSTRDAHEAHLVSARYLPPTVIGYEDLDDYGGWQPVATYGQVWYPRQVAAGWAPYHYGHWAWVEPWGWTWVDDTPWGFAPFHYGRWIYIGNRWGWAPGPIAVGYQGPVGYVGPVVRPYYAPAMVAWFGGAHFGIGISIGGGGGPTVGWVSLGWGEVYTPTYTCSPRYFTNVNVANTTVVKTVNITNVYNTVYVNKTVYNQTFVNAQAPGAVVAMRQSAMAGGQPVRQAAVTVPAAQVAQLRQAAVVAPPVVPTRQAVAPSLGRPAPQPPAQMAQRQVVAKATPPPAPVSFAARQQYLQQHVGQPHNFTAMHQAVAPAAKPVVPIRQVKAAAAPVQVHPGQKVGNQAVFQNRPIPGGRPAAPAQAKAPQTAPAAPGHPTPAPAAATHPAPAPATATRPTPAPGTAAKQTAPSETAPRTPVATPPSRAVERPAPGATRTEATPAPRPAERTQPTAPRTTATTPAPEARPAERTTPRTEVATPPARTAERPQPAPAARSTATAPETRRPVTATSGTHPAPTATHTAPPAREERTAPPASKKEEKNTQKKEEKKTSTTTEH